MPEAVQLVDAEARATKLSRSRLRLQAEHFLWALFWVDDNDGHMRARRLRSSAGRLAGADTTERVPAGAAVVLRGGARRSRGAGARRMRNARWCRR
ncbi:hypothetical protein ACU686_00990 [Yinghuangia aomiensis]